METKNELVEIKNKMNELVITSPQDVEKAHFLLKHINHLIKKVKESFEPIIKKAHDAHSEAICRRDGHLEPLEAAKKAIGSKVAEYNRNEELKQIAAREVKTKEAADVGDYFGEIEARTPTDIPTPKGMYFKETWRAEVVDEKLVPREFLTVDVQKLNAYARTMKDKAVVTGVRFFSEQSTVVRA